jgi:hypothetical protein
MAADEDALDVRKKHAEIAKIEAEVAKLANEQRWFWSAVKGVKLTEWVTATAAVAIVVTGWFSGFFNATRERLETDKNRLGMEKIELERQKEKIGHEIAARERELADVRTRLLPFEQEAAAIQSLRDLKNKLIEVRFSVTPAFDGYKVRIEGRDPKLDWDAPRVARLNPHVSSALEAVNRLRSLKGLLVDGLRMKSADLQVAGQHSELEDVRLINCSLEAADLAGLKTLSKVRALRLEWNELQTFDGCGPFPSVTSLDVSGNPLGDRGLESLRSAFPNVAYLSITGTRVTDVGMAHLAKLPSLRTLDLESTAVTGQGLLKLFESPTLTSVAIGKDRVSDEVAASIRRKRPNETTLILRDREAKAQWALDRARHAW